MISAARAWQQAQLTVSKLELTSTSTKYTPTSAELQDDDAIRTRPRFTEPVTIQVLSSDMMETAWRFSSSPAAASASSPRDRVLLHNMCNDTQRGGFPWTTGAMEEALFRESDISGRLPAALYPLRPLQAVVTTGVRLLSHLKDEVIHGSVDVLSSAAVNVSGRAPGKRLSEQDAWMMRAKIECLLYVAWLLGYTCLVLSAWGCGGFGCPPEHVAELFQNALGAPDSRWRYAFRRVVFCIKDNDGHGAHSNYRVFQELLAPSPRHPFPASNEDRAEIERVPLPEQYAETR